MLVVASSEQTNKQTNKQENKASTLLNKFYSHKMPFMFQI